MPDRHGYYSYYDSPDGEDGHKKAWYICRNLAKLAIFTGTGDAFIVKKAKTPLGALTIYGKHFSILVGTGLAFVCGTYISTDLRGKDDGRNHVVGGLAASFVFASATSSPLVFAVLAGVSSPFLHLNKTLMNDGVNLWKVHDRIKELHREFPSANWHTFEFDRREKSLKSMYEEKNEEFYRQLKAERESEARRESEV